MIRKRFSKSLYKKNDIVAKEAATKYYEGLSYIVEENDDKFGPDLIIEKVENSNIVQTYVECEVKRVWKDYEFPFENVQFPERKAKYLKLDKPITFFMLNNKGNRALIVKGEDLAKSPMKEVPNKYVHSGELFFQVGLDKISFVDLK